jgi:hypothetical protein
VADFSLPGFCRRFEHSVVEWLWPAAEIFAARSAPERLQP